MERRIAPEEIESLIAQFQKSGCAELRVSVPGLDIVLSRDAPRGTSMAAPADAPAPVQAAQAAASASAAAPEVTASPAPPSPAPAAEAIPAGAVVVAAPYLGSFYRAPKPGEPAYVEIGSIVTPDSDLCLIEVMKLFTALKSGVAGKVLRILATDGQMVAEGDPLFVIAVDG